MSLLIRVTDLLSRQLTTVKSSFSDRGCLLVIRTTPFFLHLKVSFQIGSGQLFGWIVPVRSMPCSAKARTRGIPVNQLSKIICGADGLAQVGTDGGQHCHLPRYLACNAAVQPSLYVLPDYGAQHLIMPKLKSCIPISLAYLGGTPSAFYFF